VGKNQNAHVAFSPISGIIGPDRKNEVDVQQHLAWGFHIYTYSGGL